VQETKITTVDATALGVFGLALITFVASTQKMGWTTGSAYLIPWALFLGCAAQIWAAAADFKRNNYFGSIVLGAFGLFWLAVAAHWFIANEWIGELPANADAKQFGYACFAFAIFSVFITIAAWEANKVFGIILTLIVVLLVSLGLQSLGVAPDVFSQTAAWSEFIVSLLGFYGAGALFLNGFFGRKVLPLGKPMGWVKKAA
jgi:succinate-acetate transporter protein